jgi:DNA-binding XRE family transcriptional regulator
MPLTRIIDFANYYKISLDYLFEISNKNNYVPLKINKKNVGEHLLRLRKLNNMTQEEVSKRLNISTGTYCDYENGRNLIKTNALYGLTQIYKPFSLDKIFKK